MEPISTLASMATAVNHAFSASKGILEALSRGDNNIDELLRRMREVNGLLIEAQIAIHAVAEENRDLKDKLADRDNLTELRKRLFIMNGVIWKKARNGSIEDHPYCPLCWEVNDRLVHLSLGASQHMFRCTIHDTVYEAPQSGALVSLD